MAQRFKQFNGLVDNCEFGLGEKETTTTDLTGFWEMIYFQVEDVNVKFDELVKLKAAGWKKVEPVKEKIIKKKPVATKKTVTGAKSKFAAYRAKMLAQKKGREDVEKPESPKAMPAVAVEAVVDPSETKTFYAGFFSVSSPVRNTSQPSSAAPTPKASARKSLVRPRRSTPLGGSPFLRAVLNSSLRRSLSKHSLDTSLFTDPVAPPTETPKRMLSEVDEVSESESVVATGTPRRSTRRSVRLSQLQNVPSTQKGGGDSMAQYFLPTEHKENALTPVNQSSKIDDSISFKDSPVFPETPRTYSRKRGASLLFTPISSPAKKSRPSGTEDLMCFSPLPSPATPTPKSVV
ncbi:hypothetical protein CAPTEDRAFT_180142 [Capitella teleta]|uniref:Disks large-associated protein 5 n=1 Tax=Capitella teleta TaxID=283909 RepID=N1PB06_CAPTE|nr:hypothetical protein CAPTEDRAFT_180142 [Capitella teleta]|eukprot:ELU18828.1 hypothetical protein CAPTEDRAFT_180142 [Capitella teleta]